MDHATRGIQRAHQWGIRSTPGVLEFLGLRLELGEDMDHRPEIRSFLEEGGSSPEVKVYSLRALLPATLQQRGEKQE